jgi:tetratricopeptide (TPR) repeat protein
MNDRNKWTLEERQRKTIQKELNHARLYLARAQQWNVKFTTEEAPENLRKMDSRIGSIEIALQRTADPKQLNQPELARDLAITLSDYYDKRGRWDDWIKLGSLGLEACLKLGDTYSLGEAYPLICNGIGITYRMLGKLNESMSFYEKALERATADAIKSDTFTNMADIHRLFGETEKGILCAQQAVVMGQRSGDKNREAKGLEYMGLTYTALKRYDEAIECHRQALLLREETKNLPRIALVLDFLSAALAYRGAREDLEKALNGYQRALMIEKQLNDSQRIAGCYGALGVIYCKLFEYGKAIENLEMALNLSTEIRFFRGVTVYCIWLAYAYLGSNNLKLALFHISEFCKDYQHLMYPERVALAPIICQILFKLVEHFEIQENLEQIRKIAEIAIKFALEANEEQLLEKVKQSVTMIEAIS